jgi:SAM-dependent methyltransferase
MFDDRPCPSCAQASMEVFYEQQNVPIHSLLLLDTQEEARSFPRGRLEVAVCHSCGFVSNLAFDAELLSYNPEYEETQGFSPHFQAFAERLAKEWVERHELHAKTVLEIGCGKGEFLALMCEAGASAGIGIDPAIAPERLDTPVADRLEFIGDLYDERYLHLAADAVVCRHTLEHIHPVAQFVSLVARGMESARNPDPVLLLEVPETLRILNEAAFWDIYYEHCSYFTRGSLARLYASLGLETTASRVDFDGQYIIADARRGSAPPPAGLDTPAQVLDAVGTFRARIQTQLAGWDQRLREAAAAGRSVVLWGGGSKAVSFLTSVPAAADVVRAAVDINPHKQERFICPTGHEVIAPERLRLDRPDLVIAMNPAYLSEIGAALHSLGVDDAELVAV